VISSIPSLFAFDYIPFLLTYCWLIRVSLLIVCRIHSLADPWFFADNLPCFSFADPYFSSDRLPDSSFSLVDPYFSSDRLPFSFAVDRLSFLIVCRLLLPLIVCHS